MIISPSFHTVSSVAKRTDLSKIRTLCTSASQNSRMGAPDPVQVANQKTLSRWEFLVGFVFLSGITIGFTVNDTLQPTSELDVETDIVGVNNKVHLKIHHGVLSTYLPQFFKSSTNESIESRLRLSDADMAIQTQLKIHNLTLTPEDIALIGHIKSKKNNYAIRDVDQTEVLKREGIASIEVFKNIDKTPINAFLSRARSSITTFSTTGRILVSSGGPLDINNNELLRKKKVTVVLLSPFSDELRLFSDQTPGKSERLKADIFGSLRHLKTLQQQYPTGLTVKWLPYRPFMNATLIDTGTWLDPSFELSIVPQSRKYDTVGHPAMTFVSQPSDAPNSPYRVYRKEIDDMEKDAILITFGRLSKGLLTHVFGRSVQVETVWNALLSAAIIDKDGRLLTSELNSPVENLSNEQLNVLRELIKCL